MPDGVRNLDKAPGPSRTSRVRSWMTLFEPQGTVNTGDAGGALTAELRELAV